MARPDYTIKKNDAGRIISGQFKDANNAVVSCVGQTSRKMFMRRPDGTLKIDAANFNITNEATGSFSYTWQAADLDETGEFQVEFEVTLPGPVIATFPTNEHRPYLIVKVIDDLG
jgi:hypothetical protein